MLGASLQRIPPAVQPNLQEDAFSPPCPANDDSFGEILTEARTLESATDAEKLIAAARTLGLSGTKAIPHAGLLASRLRDERPEVRRVISWALGQLGATATTSHVKELAACLEDPDAATRFCCAGALRCAGPSGARALSEKVVSSDSHVHDTAEQAISLMGAEGAEALASWLSAQDPDVRRRALLAIGLFKEVASPWAQQVSDLLNDQHKAVRLAAAEALGLIALIPDHSVDALASLLLDKDVGARCKAIAALGCIGKPASPHTAALCSMLDCKNSLVQRCAAESLGKIGAACLEKDAFKQIEDGAWTLPIESQLAFVRLLRKGDEETVQICANSLRAMGVVGATILSSQLAVLEHGFQHICLEALLHMKPEKENQVHIGAAALACHLESRKTNMRLLTLGSFARLGKSAAPHAPTCKTLWEGDADESVRKAALNALTKMGSSSEKNHVLLQDPTLIALSMECTKESRDAVRLSNIMSAGTSALQDVQSSSKYWDRLMGLRSQLAHSIFRGKQLLQFL